MKPLIVIVWLLIVSLALPLAAQKKQAPNLKMDAPAPPGSGVVCCLEVKISKFDQSVTADLLGGEVAKKISVWPVYLKNNSPTDTLRVAEGDILGRLSSLSPYDHVAMEIVMDRGQLLNKWAIAARLVMDAGYVMLLPVVADLIKTAAGLKNAVAAFVSNSPYIVSRINSRVIPGRSNYGRLGWSSDIDIPPGGYQITHVFTIRWDINPTEPIKMSINSTTGNMVRTIR